MLHNLKVMYYRRTICVGIGFGDPVNSWWHAWAVKLRGTHAWIVGCLVWKLRLLSTRHVGFCFYCSRHFCFEPYL